MSITYKNKSRICDREFREIIKYFSLDIEATKISKLTGKNRNTINPIIKYIREVMAKYCEDKSPFIGGEIEMDECDAVVPRTKVADFIKFSNSLQNKYKIRIKSFGHAGDGNLHIYILKR